ncbi:MAG: FG-GAP repeat protein [Flavobacteriales bacterium]|nr:FG-GAP repeat protein [Flavobacteriales bacterium]
MLHSELVNGHGAFTFEVDRVARTQGPGIELHADRLHTGADRWDWEGDGITYQFLREKAGVRQNFIVHAPPAGHGRLEVTLRLTTRLRPVLGRSGEMLLLDPEADEVVLSYAGLQVWDANGKDLEAGMELESLGGSQWRVVLATELGDAAFPVTIDPISTSPNTLLYANWQAGTGYYGFSVSTAGDLNGDGYSDVVIGAPTTDFGQFEEGVAFVYYGRSGGIIGSPNVPDVTLQMDRANSEFGYSVSMAGDVNGDGYSDVVIGETHPFRGG